MPLAIELFFDAQSDAAVRSLWAALAREGVCDYMLTSQARPHVSLSVFDDLKETELTRILTRFVAAHPKISLHLAAQGRFPQSEVTFLAPKPSIKLLSMQQWLHTELVRAGAVVWPHYLPSAWVPHCTLTTKAAPTSSEKLTRILDTHPLPSTFWVETVGLVRFRPVAHLHSYALCA